MNIKNEMMNTMKKLIILLPCIFLYIVTFAQKETILDYFMPIKKINIGYVKNGVLAATGQCVEGKLIERKGNKIYTEATYMLVEGQRNPIGYVEMTLKITPNSVEVERMDPDNLFLKGIHRGTILLKLPTERGNNRWINPRSDGTEYSVRFEEIDGKKMLLLEHQEVGYLNIVEVIIDYYAKGEGYLYTTKNGQIIRQVFCQDTIDEIKVKTSKFDYFDYQKTITEYYRSAMWKKLQEVSIEKFFNIAMKNKITSYIKGMALLHISPENSVNVIQSTCQVQSEITLWNIEKEKILYSNMLYMKEPIQKYSIDHKMYYLSNEHILFEKEVSVKETTEVGLFAIKCKKGIAKYYYRDNRPIPTEIKAACANKIVNDGTYIIGYLMAGDKTYCNVMNINDDIKKRLIYYLKSGMKPF